MRSRVLLPLAALAGASLWCVFLQAVREYEFGFGHPYLAWNLFLAWIPLLLALWLVAAYRSRSSAIELFVLGALWLLFLPNAPYLLTDFIHIGERHRMFDTILFGSFAFTGLALGFASLLLVQLVVTRAAGALLGWVTAVGSLFVASIGIYLGRELRFNSWDAWQQPQRLLEVVQARAGDPFGNPRMLGFVVAFCGFLTLAYLGVYGFSTLAASVRRDER